MPVFSRNRLVLIDVLGSPEDGKCCTVFVQDIFVLSHLGNEPQFSIQMCLAAGVVAELAQAVLAYLDITPGQD